LIHHRAEKYSQQNGKRPTEYQGADLLTLQLSKKTLRAFKIIPAAKAAFFLALSRKKTKLASV